MSEDIPFRRKVSLAELEGSIGTQIGVSRWFAMDQARIAAFADITEDRQFIHLDPDRAKDTMFGGTVAHGMLTLSMLSAMAYDALPAVDGMAASVNYGFDTLRFVAPVPSGAQIRARFHLRDLKERAPGQMMSLVGVSVDIKDHDKPALIADWRILYLL